MLPCYRCGATAVGANGICGNCGLQAFASPYAMPPAGGTMRPRRNVKGLGLSLIILLGVNVLADLLYAVALNRRHTLVGQMLDARLNGGASEPSLSDIQSSDDFVRSAGGLYLITLLACIVLMICWLFAARTNAETYSSYSPNLARGWAIGGWFIPLANLVLPLIVALDTHRGTVAGTEPGRSGNRPSGGVLTWFWWGAWVLTDILFFGALANSGSKDNDLSDPYHKLHMLQAQSGGLVPAMVTLIVSAVLLAIYVGKISKIQTARASEPYGGVAAGYGAPAYGPAGVPFGTAPTAYGQPVYGQPAYGAPAYPQGPAYGAPAYPQAPGYGPAVTQTAAVPPPYGQPQPGPAGEAVAPTVAPTMPADLPAEDLPKPPQ